MRSGKRPSRGDRPYSAFAGAPWASGASGGSAFDKAHPAAVDEDAPPEFADAAGDLAETDDSSYDIFRVQCPDCARPIALLAEEDTLPEHALCPTPWNPFGLTVCPGAGRSVEDAAPIDSAEDGGDVAALLTLPEGLDWRMQPFSHAGVARPRRLPQPARR